MRRDTPADERVLHSMEGLTLFIPQLINGLRVGSIYALIALAGARALDRHGNG